MTSPFQTVLLNVNLNWRLLCNEQSKDDPLLAEEKLAIKVFFKNNNNNNKFDMHFGVFLLF